jgi:hypothetical protein
MEENKEQSIDIVNKTFNQSAPIAPIVRPALSVNPISNMTAQSRFSDTVDEAKIKTIQDAAANDKKFTEDFKSELKQATLKSAQLEKEKQELERQNVEYHQELLQTQQKLNQHIQAENKWDNKQKLRQFAYDGVKPIMLFVGINEPMNRFVLYVLVCILFPFFLIGKFFKGTVGALISGADSNDRGKAVKGFFWTLLGIFTLCALSLIVYLALGWIGIL